MKLQAIYVSLFIHMNLFKGSKKAPLINENEFLLM